MDEKKPTTTDSPSPGDTQFPPYSLCGSVQLWHIHNRVGRPTAELSANPLLATSPPLLVYDGSCGLCSRSVQFILRHERRHDLLFVTRDSQFGQDLRRHFHLEDVESMLWIADGRAAIESDSVLSSAKYIGGAWSAVAWIGSLIPAALRNWGYRLIARNRRRFPSGIQACLLPTADQRARFLS